MSFTDGVKNVPRLPNGGSDPIGFLTTGIDPSRLFRITINISLIIAPYRIPSFRAEVRMLYEKTGRRLCDTERRIYYSDDTLPFPSL